MSARAKSRLEGLSGFGLTALFLDRLQVERLGSLEDGGRFTWDVQYRITDDGETVFCLVVNDVTLYEAAADLGDSDDRAGLEQQQELVRSQQPESDGVGPQDEPAAVASLRVAHMVIFSKPEGDISQNQREELLRVARMAVHPLVRAQVLTSTSDLGFPPLTLPLLHYAGMPSATDLDAETDQDSA